MSINKFRKVFLYFLLLNAVVLSGNLAVAAQSAKAAFTDSVLTAKNFPLLSVLQQNSRVRAFLQKDKVFQKTGAIQRECTEQALRQCSSVACYADALKWNEKEIITAGNELVRLYKQKKALRKIIPQLRKQGAYALYEAAADTALLRHAWSDAAKGINRIFDVYIKGEAPRYAKIDSISFKPGDTTFKKQLQNSLEELTRGNGKNVFFELPLRAALSVLEMNGRDEAARYEHLKEGLNRQPFLKIKDTDFSSYPYSMILAPGLGPETPGVALEPRGAKRCEEGVRRFRRGLAPFIVVSGGHVHPYKTPYNEAVEMKKYMVEQLGVPADVIFIEPHARHTTTNLRNTSRMIYRFGLPADKPVLIVTDTSQSSYIIERMAKTAMRDLGYVPYKNLKKLSEEETEFYPVWNSLQADPFDPLDP